MLHSSQTIILLCKSNVTIFNLKMFLDSIFNINVVLYFFLISLRTFSERSKKWEKILTRSYKIMYISFLSSKRWIIKKKWCVRTWNNFSDRIQCICIFCLCKIIELILMDKTRNENCNLERVNWKKRRKNHAIVDDILQVLTFCLWTNLHDRFV